MLGSLGKATGSNQLLGKIKRGDTDAWAELLAIHLVCNGRRDTAIDLEPSVLVGGRHRKPDFRIRRRQQAWTYVEVTRPNSSAAQVGLLRDMQRLADLVNDCTGSFALEVYLKRRPSDEELDLVRSQITQGHRDVATRAIDLASGLGTLYWNTKPPGTVVVDDHGEPYTPRLGIASVAIEGGDHRHVAVIAPFTDKRAKAFLDSEAKQLPKESAGIIMIQTSEAAGAMKAWRGLIEPRYQPAIHTRVSAVCLFSSGQWPGDAGEEWRAQARLIINPYGRHPLPRWLLHQLDKFPSDERDLAGSSSS
jgi:hypothetical protein